MRALIPLARRTAAAVGLAAALAVATPAGAVTSGQQSPAAPPLADSLNGIAVASSSSAWAVGSYNGFHTLILHWNGTTWNRQASPKSGGAYYGVAALSRSSAWAVGFSGGAPRTLIAHWNGMSWTRQASPSPSGRNSFLYAVSALSATNAWAVGRTCKENSLNCETLIEYWNGASWTRQASPTPLGDFLGFNGVTAISPTDVWAVGWGYGTAKGQEQPLLEHWDGKSWTLQVIPNLSGKRGEFCDFKAITAASASDVWAVGDIGGSGALRTLIEHWNGTSWTRQVSPNGAFQEVDSLNGVTAVSPSNVWAAGSYEFASPQGQSERTLIEHWDGTSWKIQASPSPGGSNNISILNAVAPISGSRAWAVGVVGYGVSDKNLLEHFNGTSWKHWGIPSF